MKIVHKNAEIKISIHEKWWRAVLESIQQRVSYFIFLD
jgi:hypothetical protein